MFGYAPIRQAARPTPSWMQPGSAFHIKPAAGAGWSWINGTEFTSFANLINTPSAATFSRPSEAYGLTSAGTFTRFDSGVPAITDLGLLAEPAETTIHDPNILNGTGSATSTGCTVLYQQVGPFGNLGFKITATGGSSSVRSRTVGAATPVLGTNYLIWTIVEAMTADFYQMTMASTNFGTQTYANFDLKTTNGATGNKGTNVTSSGIVKLSAGRFLCWMIAPATASASGGIIQAIVPLSTSGRLAANTSIASFITSAAQISIASRWGSPITKGAAPATRAAVALKLKPPAATYGITVRYGDGTVDQVFSSQVVSGSGWDLPVANLNGRFITDIIGVAA